MLTRLKRRLLGRLAYLPYLYTKQEWDAQYAAGRWDLLRRKEEFVHHNMIAGYIRRYGAGQSILDVGCGEGVLQEVLGSAAYEHYMGIDIAEEAIRRAGGKRDSRTDFACHDVRTFVPGHCYQTIVFNECLYYFEDPLGIARRYEKFLNDTGVFIVSMYAEKQNRHIWKMLDATYAVEDEVKITCGVGISWVIKVFRPGNRSNAGAAGG